MKVKNIAAGLMVLFLGLVLTGCAVLSTKSTADTCTNTNTNNLLRSGGYQKKVDNFLIIQDASSTMGENYGKTYSYDSTKLHLSKDMIRCLNNSLPSDFDAEAGMRVFGSVHADDGRIYGMTQYSNAGLANAVLSVTGTGGITPIANALIYGAYDLQETPGLTDTPGKTAVILFSDGLDNGGADPVAAAATMKDMYGNNVCIYTVLLGNDPAGRITMEQIAEAGRCGYATDLETIGYAQGMDKFVTDVFLEKGAPAPVSAPAPMKKMVDPDSDGDSVPDSLDQCPNTPKGIKVDSVGCPVPIPTKVSITLLVEFDFDKDTVKPRYNDDLEKVANFLKAYPDTKVELEGHTDSIGSDEYNMQLSKRRAASVKKYLVGKFGIDAARLSTTGYGESQPVASNKTDAGRQKNRRVMANIESMTMK